MRKRLISFWENYKYRFVPWIIYHLKPKKQTEGKLGSIDNLKSKHNERFTTSSSYSSTSRRDSKSISSLTNLMTREDSFPSSSSSPLIVQHVNKKDEKLITDDELTEILTLLFEKFLHSEMKNGNASTSAKDISKRNQNIMVETLGYSIERRKSIVAEDAGIGVFLSSGRAPPGSLIALYPGTIYMPSEPLFIPSIGNPFIFRCSDGVHIDGNDKWISKSIYKSCSARDKFRMDLPCCDDSWLSPTGPMNPLNIGQYVNNRSKCAKNNVVYQESSLTLCGESTMTKTVDQKRKLPIHFCKYLPNVWANPGNNHHPLRLVPLVAVKEINEGDEILSSYFTLVHTESASQEL